MILMLHLKRKLVNKLKFLSMIVKFCVRIRGQTFRNDVQFRQTFLLQERFQPQQHSSQQRSSGLLSDAWLSYFGRLQTPLTVYVVKSILLFQLLFLFFAELSTS
ncbi:Hypothetical protein PHPALM_8859 [Phytophthora palmivora]|uniref:Uncharacterized protein n=1 Tax=Phytophthora palmivora TaxID=4796 RepID=A0A2P4Y8U0_9STRA|nr:Hypothetical protein PHPALM_8859 [Phytophthora palmivora]